MVVTTQKINILTIFTQKGLKRMRENINGWNQSMSAPLERMKKIQTAQGGWNRRMVEGRTVMGRAALNLRKMTHGMRGFRMEMLGVMFFGMALVRIFGGLLNKSLEWTGVMEIMSVALGILFLPVAMKLLDWALRFLDFVSQLTEGQKKWIGTTVLIIIGLGILLAIIGTLALGIGSIILVFGKLMASGFGLVKVIKIVRLIFSAMMTSLGAFIVVIIGVILIVKGLAMIIKGKFEGIGLVIMGIGVILLLFIGWWALIPIAVGAAVFLIIKHWDKVKKFFSNLWQGIKDGASSVWEFIKNIFSKISKKISGSFIGKAFKKAAGLLGFKHGGIVPGKLGTPVPIMAHAGERVTPANRVREEGGGNAPNINITATISSDYDVRRMAEELKRYWVSDFERVSQGRTA